jgi:undecaprenyl-diphosphatase
MRAILALTAASGAAIALYATSKAVATGESAPVDHAVRHEIRREANPLLDAASATLTFLTAPALLIPASFALAFDLRRRGTRVWLPIASSPVLAMLAGALFTKTLPQQTAPSAPEPSFPSGHTTGLTAETLTASYLLRRERKISRTSAAMLVCLPILGGLNRLYRDRHWSSDIAAGWAAGSGIAATLIALSELSR